MFALGGMWVASKLLGFVWWVIRAPFVRLFYYFVDDRVFAGVNRLEEDDQDMSSYDDDEAPENRHTSVAATIATTQQQSIAIQQNERNALLLQAKAEALAAMVEEGIITETKGLQIVFGVRPSSTNPRYLAARAALHAELEKRRGTVTPIAQRPTPATFASDKVRG
jgi:hypothetical protein